jgi:hypothetical protein
MKKPSYLPNDDNGKVVWLNNFAEKLPRYAAKFNITAAEQADVLAGAKFFDYLIGLQKSLDTYYSAFVKYKNQIRDGLVQSSTTITNVVPPIPILANPTIVPFGIFERSISIGERILKFTSCLESDARDLGIYTEPKKAADKTTGKPVVKMQFTQGGKPELVWKKMGFDGIEIHVNRGDGYEFLANDMRPNFIDNYSIGNTPKVWKYKCIYLYNDIRVGEWSDEIQITVSPDVDDN